MHPEGGVGASIQCDRYNGVLGWSTDRIRQQLHLQGILGCKTI
jgi:hypothetical protein